MSNWKIIMQNLIIQTAATGSGDVVIARVNQNIVGWEKNVHILANSEAMLEMLEELVKLPGFEPKEPYGEKVLKLIEKARGRAKTFKKN